MQGSLGPSCVLLTSRLTNTRDPPFYHSTRSFHLLVYSSFFSPLPALTSSSRPPPQNNANETPLHCAAQYGHSGVVRILLEELTDPTMRNNKFETPLDLAALYGRLEVVKLLLSAHPNLLSCNTKKHTPLHLASRNGHLSVVEVLLGAGMDINYEVCFTPGAAALSSRAAVAQMLLDELIWACSTSPQHFLLNAIRLNVKVSSPFAKEPLCSESTAGRFPPWWC